MHYIVLCIILFYALYCFMHYIGASIKSILVNFCPYFLLFFSCFMRFLCFLLSCELLGVATI